MTYILHYTNIHSPHVHQALVVEADSVDLALEELKRRCPNVSAAGVTIELWSEYTKRFNGIEPVANWSC